jgi:hypothetical protein
MLCAGRSINLSALWWQLALFQINGSYDLRTPDAPAIGSGRHPGMEGHRCLSRINGRRYFSKLIAKNRIILEKLARASTCSQK